MENLCREAVLLERSGLIRRCPSSGTPQHRLVASATTWNIEFRRAFWVSALLSITQACFKIDLCMYALQADFQIRLFPPPPHTQVTWNNLPVKGVFVNCLKRGISYCHPAPSGKNIFSPILSVSYMLDLLKNLITRLLEKLELFQDSRFKFLGK